MSKSWVPFAAGIFLSQRILCRAAAVSAVLLCGVLPLSAAQFITNGDFSANGSQFVVWPGSLGATATNGTGTNPSSIPGWTGSGINGLGTFATGNNLTLGNNGGIGAPITPYTDNGSVPQFAAVMQASGTGGSSTLGQTLTGLNAGGQYVVTFNYDARNCCGDTPNLNINVGSANTQIDNIQPVGGANPPNPYYSVTVPFTASAGSQNLLLTTTNHNSILSDASTTVTNFSVQAVHEVTIVNSSFEANSNPSVGYGPINGWTESGAWGTNPGAGGNFFIPGHNGANATPPDGSQVAFSQGDGTLDQMISGLVVGKTYTLTFFDGHRNGDAGPGDTVTAKIGGVTLGTDTPNVNEYTPHAYTFIASAAIEDLMFVHGNVTADQSIAIDDVAIYAVVPEPSSFILGGLGVLGLLVAARRRRKA